ncbi:type IX secretion system plug protein [Pseudofulvibacter geojedonensis]|uniref:DUF5103 domain-containing protein n=1 Tax=Pseudofulvibacter geojedonensis TaxID=1123758 RepID=A0ABW3I194_9FLAO
MRLFLTITSLLTAFICSSQVTNEVNPPENIKTIILQELTSERQIPLIKLGKTLTLKFDDINGDEADYYYRINQYNFDWTPSALMKSEYLRGMDEQHIQDYVNSYNTLQIYSHFRLSIPNENVRITKTGNYIIEIYDDEDEIVFSKKFIVYQDRANVGVEIKRSRDLNHIESKQVVQFHISPQNNFFNNPKQNIKTLVFKNNNIKNSITNLKPQYTIGNKLMYRYDQEASFWAGNEYFYFDNKDIRGGNISLRRTELKDLYHNYLYTNRSRRHDTYTYNPDINGGFVVRNLNADNSNIEADYTQIHFSLENFENIGSRKIYVIGNFNNYQLDKNSELKFDQESGLYKNTSLIKQGFVNYKFITLTNNKIDHSFIDGNFYQTENEYTVVVYYRDIGARYDQVIGLGSASSINISN